MSQYILNKDHTPKKCSDTLEWGKWMGDHTHRVVTVTKTKAVTVSTVFLGLDHNFAGGKPVLFETMIFGIDNLPEYQVRYCTWDEAVAGHKEACEKIGISE